MKDCPDCSEPFEAPSPRSKRCSPCKSKDFRARQARYKKKRRAKERDKAAAKARVGGGATMYGLFKGMRVAGMVPAGWLSRQSNDAGSEAREWNAKARADRPPGARRKCLGCGEMFESGHVGNRVCPACKNTNVWRSGGGLA